MKNKVFSTKSILSLLVIFALLAALALNFTACADKNDSLGEGDSSSVESQSQDTPNLGEGSNSFTLKVTKADGTTKTFLVKTDEQNVGDAIVKAGIASGEQGAFGWYLLTVDGETHKYEDDGKYWAFYVDGMMSPKGVSEVMVNAASDCFELRVEE